MPTYIPGISASGTLAPGLTPAVVRAVLELLSSAEIAAAYLPLAGGTMAGDLDMDHYGIINVQSIDSDEITLNSVPVATTVYVDDEVSANGVSLQAFASNASNLTSGTVSDARLSANVPRLNAASNAFSGAVTVPRISSPTSELPIFQSGADRANFSNGALTVTTFVGICASNPGAPDVFVRRNATGPTAETRAAGGLRVCNADGSALAALACGTINATASGTATTPSITIGNTGLVGFINQSNACVWVAGGVARGVFGGSYIGLPSTNRLAFSLSSDPLGTPDLALGRDSVGVAGLYTTFNGSTFASLNLANLTASGTVTAIGGLLLQSGATGCTITPHGGNILFKSNDLYPAKFIGASEFRQASTMALSWTDGTSFTGAVTSTISQLSSGVLQVGTTGNNALGSLNLANLTASGGITFGPRTKSALLATSATATAGVWRITDSTPAQRLAYPDGTNWRYMSDDTVVT